MLLCLIKFCRFVLSSYNQLHERFFILFKIVKLCTIKNFLNPNGGRMRFRPAHEFLTDDYLVIFICNHKRMVTFES